MTEQQRIDRFETAYNRIDRHMEELIGEKSAGHRRPFASKVRMCANRYRRFSKFVNFLLEIGDLRNAMVHNRTGDDLYLAVPSLRTVEELERIEQRMFSPLSVAEKFTRTVVTLRPEQSLADALGAIRGDGFSRYPVYGGDGFIGLVTANGFTRWVASQFGDGVISFDPHQVTIETILEFDHRRDQALLVSRTALVDEVVPLFASRKDLEAVIITEHGKPHERPIGMIAPPDIAGYEW